DSCGDDGIEFGKSQTMLSRESDWLAEPKPEGFHQTMLSRLALGLVADQVHMLAGLAQDLGEALVERHHAGAGVDHEEDDVSFADCQLGLLAHAIFERAVLDVLITSRVENTEGQIGDAALGLAAVARNAGGVVD